MTASSFEEEWPALAARLGKRMARSCPDACEREDLVQEVGLRLFRMWDRVDDRPLWPLVLTIALNLRRDAHRSWHEPAILLTQDLPASFDVEREGLARVELRRVQQALQLLSEAHRSVLLAEIGKLPPMDMTPASMKMTRMRARRRLHQLLDSGSGAFALIPLRFKDRLIGWRNETARRLLSIRHDVDLAPFAAGVVAAAITLTAPAPASVTEPRDRVDLASNIKTAAVDIGEAKSGKQGEAAQTGQSSGPVRRGSAVGTSTDDGTSSGPGSYRVGLPGGEAEVAAEGMFAGSRLALGPIAPTACIGAPGSGSCGTNDGPLIKMRVGFKYGSHRIEREIIVDPGTSL